MDQMQSNFEFLDQLDSELANLGRLSESYFQEDPSTTLIKLRQFSERLACRHAVLMGVDLAGGETQADQRILAKAFAGELVLQDPTDEPATHLLARIREARATAPKRGRRKRVAT
jgi:hypothetical protein